MHLRVISRLTGNHRDNPLRAVPPENLPRESNLMFSASQAKMMMEMFSNPMFRQGAGEFFSKMNQEGIDSARKFWNDSPYAGMFPDQQQLMERLYDFYRAMGVVPLSKYEDAQKEIESLKQENAQLRNTLRDLQQSFLVEGGTKAQHAWQEVMDKQIELNREATRSFFEALNQFQSPRKK